MNKKNHFHFTNSSLVDLIDPFGINKGSIRSAREEKISQISSQSEGFLNGVSPSGKASVFDTDIQRFESFYSRTKKLDLQVHGSYSVPDPLSDEERVFDFFFFGLFRF